MKDVYSHINTVLWPKLYTSKSPTHITTLRLHTTILILVVPSTKSATMATQTETITMTAPVSQGSQGSQLDRHGYLFGLKIQASMSPLLHRTIYQELGLRWEQQLFESADISGFLNLIKNPDFYGLSLLLLTCA